MKVMIQLTGNLMMHEIMSKFSGIIFLESWDGMVCSVDSGRKDI